MTIQRLNCHFSKKNNKGDNSARRVGTRQSVNMVAELRNGTEDYSAVAKATTATAVALDTKAFTVVAMDLFSLVALKPTSKSGVDSVVDWMQWFRAHIGTGGPAAVYLFTSLEQVHRMPGRLIGESLGRLGNPTFNRTRNS